MKKAIALRLLKSPTVRKTAVKALKNPKVRGILAKQVKRRVLGK
ncbi:MAG: hypothetical protein AVDCRST_MAG02-2719 [uncultured Rubrobacteraceae bacterium]|uniref:Uncharacterized protein n=1 Tax=uncultured Rubrobacteraceae bacterium TaxID=349277 RepID=A0A6J4R8C4_9ACTN|nr:MAG: hypothetical protein AVDCRST_MAG02-2719 [uncultured Rubrobacteraceae bacterium]